MYDVAELSVMVWVVFQNRPLPSLNCVPPTAVTSGKLAGIPAVTPLAACGVGASASQVAAPESPDDAITVIPCAFACCTTARSERSKYASQPPQLTLMIGATLLSAAAALALKALVA